MPKRPEIRCALFSSPMSNIGRCDRRSRACYAKMSNVCRYPGPEGNTVLNVLWRQTNQMKYTKYTLALAVNRTRVCNMCTMRT